MRHGSRPAGGSLWRAKGCLDSRWALRLARLSPESAGGQDSLAALPDTTSSVRNRNRSDRGAGRAAGAEVPARQPTVLRTDHVISDTALLRGARPLGTRRPGAGRRAGSGLVLLLGEMSTTATLDTFIVTHENLARVGRRCARSSTAWSASVHGDECARRKPDCRRNVGVIGTCHSVSPSDAQGPDSRRFPLVPVGLRAMGAGGKADALSLTTPRPVRRLKVAVQRLVFLQRVEGIVGVARTTNEAFAAPRR